MDMKIKYQKKLYTRAKEVRDRNGDNQASIILIAQHFGDSSEKEYFEPVW